MLGERVDDSDVGDNSAGTIGVEGGAGASVSEVGVDGAGAAGTGVLGTDVEGNGVSVEDGVHKVVGDGLEFSAAEEMVGPSDEWREVGVLGIMFSDGRFSATFMCLAIPLSSALMVWRSWEMAERSVAALGTGGIRDRSTATNVGILVMGKFKNSLTMSSKFVLFLFCPILFMYLKVLSLHLACT